MDRIKGAFCLVVGTILLVGAIASTLAIRQFTRDSVVVEARVVRLNAGGSHPEIVFKTLQGEPISYPQGGLIGGYKVGDSVRVRYRVAEPSRSATLDRFGALFFWPLFLGLAGGYFTLWGAGAVRRKTNG